MVDVSKEIHDFEKDPGRMEAVVSLGNGFSVKLIKGKRKDVEPVKLPEKRGPRLAS
jgi:hypothetical protein